MASPPAWSIGSSRRGTDIRGGGLPGPGQYSSKHVHHQTSPSWKLGTSIRGNDIRSTTPGPGTYNSPGKIITEAPHYGFGHKTATSMTSFTPGPGAYNNNGLRGFDQKSPSYSFRMKTNAGGGNELSPGPGTYDQRSRIGGKNAPAYRVGTAKRSGLYNQSGVPGPGAYSRPGSSLGMDAGPKYGFGTSNRGSGDGMYRTAPGPGAYNFKGEFDGGMKGITIAPRRSDGEFASRSRSPGPGTYNPSAKFQQYQSPSYKMGTSSRDDLHGKSAAPGPGNYDPRWNKSGKNIRIGNSLRPPLTHDSKTPGPGSYRHGTNIGEGPKYFMNPRRDESGSLSSRYGPGPGAYSPNMEMVKTQSPTIGMKTSQRAGLHSLQPNPGPGQYDTRGKFAGPKWGFGSQGRGVGDPYATPGPGHYDHKHLVGEVPNYVYRTPHLKIPHI